MQFTVLFLEMIAENVSIMNATYCKVSLNYSECSGGAANSQCEFTFSFFLFSHLLENLE